MTRSFLGKGLPGLVLMIALGAFSTTTTRAGWFSRAKPADCGAEIPRRQAKAESACELARAKQMADLSCAQLTAIAECERQAANVQALASYQRFPIQTVHPAR